MKLIRLTTSLLSIVICRVAYAQSPVTYQVAPNGTDANNTCIYPFSTPCATIQRAVDLSRGFSPVLPIRDAVSVVAGTYNQTAVIAKSILAGGAQGTDARTRAGLPESIIDGGNAGITLFTLSSSPSVGGFTLQKSTYAIDLNSFPVFFNNFAVKADIHDNIFLNNSTGLLLRGLSGTLERNLFRNDGGRPFSQGILANPSYSISDFVIDNNGFQNLLTGITIDNTYGAARHTGLTISNNALDGNGTGIVLSNLDSSSVTGNVISNSGGTADLSSGTALVLAHDQNLTITRNTFSVGSKYGIRIINFGDPNSSNPAVASSNITITNNNISGFAQAGLFIDNVNNPSSGEYPAYTGTVNAICNWWGSATGPMSPDNPAGTGDAIVAASGQVNFIPWLIAPGPDSSCSGGPRFIVSQSFGQVRNNFTGFVGMKFTVGSIPLTVYTLGRINVPGNSGSHTLKLVQASTGTDVPGGSAILQTSSTASDGQYKFVTLAAPVTLPANTSYYLLSQESAGGDQWYDFGPVSSSGVASVDGPAYQDSNGTYNVLALTGQSYVPLTFVYQQQSNSLSVSITSPPSGGPALSGNISVTVATSGSIASVQLQIDGQNFGTPSTTPPFTSTLNTNLLGNGSHTLIAVASDGQGHSASSAAVTLQVSNQSGLTGSPLLTGQSPGSIRNNFSGFVGMAFTVGSLPLPVTALGRLVAPGNSGTHAIKIVLASNGADVPGASVSLSLATTTAGQYQFAALASPVQLAANTTYYLLSNETAGGDQWYDFGPVTSASGVSINGPAYRDGNGTYNVLSVPAQAYVPVNLLFGSGSSIPSAAPLITAQTPGGIRNNFSGFVGMGFTIGPTPINVASLGRLIAPGNIRTHRVKIVSASTGADVPGASVVLSTSGAAAGQYAYQALGTPIQLQANMRYYLLSEEVSGGDQWYDYGGVTPAGSNRVDGPAYIDGNNSLVLIDTLPGYAYGPVNLLFGN